MTGKFDYYYANEMSSFLFIRMPKVLFTNDEFSKLSCEAKVLYSLMLERMTLSQKNGWLDKENRVYIYFKLEEVKKYIGCSHDKASKLLGELDSKKGLGLINRIRQGFGKPDIIYVMNISLQEQQVQPLPVLEANKKQDTPSLQKQDISIVSETVKQAQPIQENNPQNQQSYPQEKNFDNQKSANYYIQQYYFVEHMGADNQNTVFRFSAPNNTKFNYTDFSDNQSIHHQIHQGRSFSKGKQIDEMDQIDSMKKYHTYAEIIRENISYETLCGEYEKEDVDEIVEIMLDTICFAKENIVLQSRQYPVELLKSRLLKLNQMHIEYVLDCMSKVTTKIYNIKKYLLTALLNAPMTMSNFYRAEVRHDMYAC